MHGLTSRLKNKLALYGKIPTRNEANEDTFDYDVIKYPVYAEILPQGGNNKEEEGNTTQSITSHKITIRSNSVDNLKDDMFFVYQNQRYDIDYFNPNFKYNDSVEISATLIVGEFKNE
jgi:hypothetical protein